MSGGMQGGGSEPILTTKGDTLGYSTEEIRNPISTDGFVLTADSTNALGIAWKEAGGGSPIWEIMTYG
jgi:hypothetical protein